MTQNAAQKPDRTRQVKARDYSNHPFVSNYPPLKEWLDQHEARCQWQVPSQPKDEESGLYSNGHDYPISYIECYVFPNGRCAIVIVHASKHGWDIYISDNDSRITATLEAAEARLGLVRP